MAWKTSGGILSQYQGFPALIFFALKDSATRQHAIHERLDTLVHIFAYLRACLPEKEGIDEKVPGLIDDIDKRIKQARHDYNPVFEIEETYTDQENKFLSSLDGILYVECEVIARTKLIDSQRIQMDTVPDGTQ